MNPTLRQVHVDAPLTNVSIATMNKDDAFVAQKVFPRVPVKKESDKFFIFDKDFLFRSKTEQRAPGAPVVLRDYKISTDSYSAEEYAAGIVVPDRVAENSDSPLSPYTNAAEVLAHDMKMFIEYNWSVSAFAASIWTSEAALSGTDMFDDYTGSDPIGKIETAKTTINGLTGIPTSELSIVMGKAVWDKLYRHPQIVANFGGGYSGMLVPTLAQVASILGVKDITVGEGVWNTNNEGNSTQTLTRILGKSLLVYYKAPSPALMAPSSGYFFSKTVAQVKRYYNERRASEIIENSSTFDFKVTMADAGYLYRTVVA